MRWWVLIVAIFLVGFRMPRDPDQALNYYQRGLKNLVDARFILIQSIIGGELNDKKNELKSHIDAMESALKKSQLLMVEKRKRSGSRGRTRMHRDLEDFEKKSQFTIKQLDRLRGMVTDQPLRSMKPQVESIRKSCKACHQVYKLHSKPLEGL